MGVIILLYHLIELCILRCQLSGRLVDCLSRRLSILNFLYCWLLLFSTYVQNVFTNMLIISGYVSLASCSFNFFSICTLHFCTFLLYFLHIIAYALFICNLRMWIYNFVYILLYNFVVHCTTSRILNYKLDHIIVSHNYYLLIVTYFTWSQVLCFVVIC